MSNLSSKQSRANHQAPPKNNSGDRGQAPTPCDLNEDYWQKSCDFYRDPQVQKLLLKLQNSHHYSINRLLFCLWFSQMFQQLIDPKLLKLNQAEITEVETSVNRLRQQRQKFDNDFGKPASGNLGKAREQMLQAELSIEREIQLRLVSSLCEGKYSPINQISAETQAFLIDENISLLCSHRAPAEESLLQKLSMLWIQQQDCYNQS
jgi:uncharacterized protein (TIGR02444 family)